MKVLIIGPGALGCLLAAKLSRGHEVWLLDHDVARAARLAETGVFLEESGGWQSCPVLVTAEAGRIGASDLTLLCVKSHQIQEALLGAEIALRHTQLLLALPNGIAHLNTLTRFRHGRCWGVGVTAQGATLAGAGRVLHRGEGATSIGWLPENEGIGATGVSCRRLLSAAAGALSEVGIPTQAVPDILPRLWAKLLVNIGINALTAIHDCPNGALLESPRLSELLIEAVREGEQVAGRLGIELPGDPVVAAQEVCRATATNISSMLQDVRLGRRTEIEAINGELVRLARELGVPVPVNEDLLGKVRELERNYRIFY